MRRIKIVCKDGLVENLNESIDIVAKEKVMNAHTIKISADTKELRKLIERAGRAAQHVAILEYLNEELFELEHMTVRNGELVISFTPSDYFLGWVSRLERRAALAGCSTLDDIIP